jgi:polysaccharide export outer membrane protein
MAGEMRHAIVMREVRALFGFGVVGDTSDRQLLERFLTADRAEADAAFTVLVERHGAMVLHVCGQVLDDAHDAQDAFQATFLVFLRRAGSIRKRDSLASWLFGVAMRVARRARYAAIVRRVHERHAGDLAAARSPATNGHSACLSALHEEIALLPERYREPMVMCHLEGLSTAAAAQRLGCAQGTILSRLARARERLRRRLTERGLAVPAGLLVGSVAAHKAAALPAALVSSTTSAAARAGAGDLALVATVSPRIAALVQATLRTLLMTRLTIAAVCLRLRPPWPP